MALTYVEAQAKAPGSRRRGRRVRLLVDSGAIYSLLPEADWKALGLKPMRDVEFVLADGTPLSRRVSECTFDVQGVRATSPVVLGEPDDEPLLGAVTLESLGLMLDPLKRRVVPMRMLLAGFRRPTR
jgi:predicted aspartyl protease